MKNVLQKYEEELKNAKWYYLLNLSQNQITSMPVMCEDIASAVDFNADMFPYVFDDFERKYCAKYVVDEYKESFLQKHNTAYLITIARRGERQLLSEFPIQRSDGSIMWMRQTIVLISGKEEEDILGLSFSYDISDIKQSDEEYLKQLRLAVKRSNLISGEAG